ncbi:MAG: WD40 repeat domain-containing protein [Rhodopila sp.]
MGKAYAVALSPDGALIAAGGWMRWTETDKQEQIYLFDRATGRLVQRIEGLSNGVGHLAFSPDGRGLAAVLGTGRGLRVYAREREWAEIARDTNYGDRSLGVAFASDGRLATTSKDGKIRLYSADLAGSVQPLTVIAAPSSSRLAIGYDDTRACPFSMDTLWACCLGLT